MFAVFSRDYVYESSVKRFNENGNVACQQAHISSLFVSACCFTTTETIRLIRDGEPRTATSTFTQFLCAQLIDDDVELNVLEVGLTY